MKKGKNRGKKNRSSQKVMIFYGSSQTSPSIIENTEHWRSESANCLAAFSTLPQGISAVFIVEIVFCGHHWEKALSWAPLLPIADPIYQKGVSPFRTNLTLLIGFPIIATL